MYNQYLERMDNYKIKKYSHKAIQDLDSNPQNWI